MKGIRKLFFGLIFMTLIGVGFKIDVKAAPTLQISPSTGDVENGALSGGTSNLVGKFLYNDHGDFPTSAGTYTYTVTYNSPSSPTVTTTIKLITENDVSGGLNWKITVGDEEVARTGEYEIFNLTQSDVKAAVESGTPGTPDTKTGEFRLSATGGDGSNISPASTSITLYKVTAAATGLTDTVNFSGLTDPYFFPGEQVDVAVITNLTSTVEANGTSTVKKFKNWTDSQNALTITDKSTNPPSCTIKMGTGGNAKATTLNAYYGTVAMSFISDTITANETTSIRQTPAGGATAYTSASKIRVDNADATSAFTFNTGGINYSNPSTTYDGENKYLEIEMPDGNVFYRYVTISSGSSEAGVSTIYVTKGKTVPLSKFITTESLKTKTTKLKSISDYTAFSKSSTATSGTNTICDIGNNIYVLGNKVTSGQYDIVVNDLSTDPVGAVVYPTPSISVSSSGGAIVDSASSSSSSDKSPFTVTMPNSVAYDTISYNNITQAQYEITGSKTASAILPLSTSSSSGSNATTKSKAASWSTVAKLLDKACDESSETVSIAAYPINPDTGLVDRNVSGTAQMTVYRIKLDSSEGAKYTVNGVDLGEIASGDHDYFYAVDGVSYTIVSSAKSTGTTLQRWDDDENNKSNTRTFTASSSKTYKAIYSSNTTTSSSRSSSSSSSTGRTTAAGGSSGSGMDDYDDVPKTGESKADIWILWSVLFISILGAGFMIWKRFGLVKAIAEADEEVAYAEHEEMAEAKKQEKESKLKMLMDLRNLK